jgi:hypothetical protein
MITTIWILSIALVVMTVIALRVNVRRQTEQYLKEHWKAEYSGITSVAMKIETELRDKLEKEQKENKFLMRRIVDQQNDMAILRKTME